MRFNIYIFFLVILGFSFASAVVYEEETEEINLYVGTYVCYSGTNYATVYNQSSYSNITIVNSTYSAGACNLTTPWCCPTGSYCSGTTYKCVYNATNPVDDCSDILTEVPCNSAPSSFAIALLNKFNSSFASSCGTAVNYEASNGQPAINVTTCNCKWNSTLSKCSVDRTISINYSSAPGVTYDCSWVESSREDQCATAASKIIVSYAASGAAKGVMEYCTNQVQEFPCDVSIKVPFFDSFTFILSALAICITYFVLNRKT